MKTSPNATPVVSLSGPVTLESLRSLHLEENLAAVIPLLRAMPPEQLQLVTVDIPKVYTTVRGLLPGLHAMRPRLIALAEFDVSMLDRLHVYLDAMVMAHALYLHRPRSRPPSLAPLARDCATRFAVLERAARSLLDGELLPAHALDKYGIGKRTFSRLALETVALSALLREHWPALHTQTALTLELLDGADRSSQALLEGLSARVRRLANDDTVLRQRAFSLFARAYEEVRRGVLYLRWYQGDADTLAPSLYTGRTSGRRKRSRTKAPALAAPPSKPAEHP